MGEYNYDAGGLTETCLENESSSALAEFNPRASPPPSSYKNQAAAAEYPHPAEIGAPFPPAVNSDARWWEILPTFAGKPESYGGTPAPAPSGSCCSPTLVLYAGRNQLLSDRIMPSPDRPRASIHNHYSRMVPPLPASAHVEDRSLMPPPPAPSKGGDPINRHNPYLADLPPARSPAAPWRLQMQQQHPAIPEGWSCMPETYQPCGETRGNGINTERGTVHKVFTDPQLSDYHPLQQQAPTIATPHRLHKSSSFSPLHQNCRDYAGTFGGRIGSSIGEDWVHGYGLDPIRLVGKSQSMRALYEENAALRRALQSMRRATHLDHSFAMHGEPLQPFSVGGEHDRCITNDAAEGRTLSMRERGRWAMPLHGDVGASGVAGAYNRGFPMRAVTPEHQYSHGMSSAVAGTHRRYRHRPHQQQQQVWDDIPAEHPLFYGGSCGGWPEESMFGRYGDYHGAAADMYNGRQSGAGAALGHDTNDGEGLSLKQLLIQTDRLGADKSRDRQGSKKKSMRQVREEAGIAKPEQGAMASCNGLSDQEGLYCAMCGGKLQQAEVQAITTNSKRAGLPLHLCSACHPCAAASFPHSTTTKSPPLSSTHARHRVATAIFMACRPTTTTNVSSGKRVKPKNRIVDICRHFVGLSAKPPAA